MQHVKVDLPKAISMVLEQIEIVGADFTHKGDPNQPQLSNGCYNVFVQTDYTDTGEAVATFHPGCLIGRVVIDSYEGDKQEISAYIAAAAEQADFVALTSALSAEDILGFNTTPVASSYLRVAQGAQDNNKAWGQAHALALSHVLQGRFDDLTVEEQAFFSPHTKVLDLEEAFRLVSEVIAEKGEDFTHQKDPMRKNAANVFQGSCVNVFTQNDENGNYKAIAPGCLVGSAIHQAGWELDKFVESRTVGSAVEDLLFAVFESGLYSDATNAARTFLRQVQSAQDHGDTWGTARQVGLEMTLRNTFEKVNGYDLIELTRAEKYWVGVRPDWHLAYVESGDYYADSI